MRRSETMMVLAKISLGDNRQLDPADAVETPRLDYWHEAIGDLDVQDALWAVAEHRRTSAEYLQPVHVRALAAKARGRRCPPVDPTKVIPNVDPDDVAAWRNEMAAIKAAINAGRFDPVAYAASGRPLTRARPVAWSVGAGPRPRELEGRVSLHPARLGALVRGPGRPSAADYGTGRVGPSETVGEAAAARQAAERARQVDALAAWAAEHPDGAEGGAGAEGGEPR